jgi:hypothetical protein
MRRRRRSLAEIRPISDEKTKMVTAEPQRTQRRKFATDEEDEHG